MYPQTALRILPHEAQQGVLKDYTALYQKSGITFNQFLATLQQRHATQRQVRRCIGLLVNRMKYAESAVALASTCESTWLHACAQSMLAAIFATPAHLQCCPAAYIM